MSEIRQRFDRLLKAMAGGKPAAQTLAEVSEASKQASSEGSSGTQTRQGKTGDASQTVSAPQGTGVRSSRIISNLPAAA